MYQIIYVIIIIFIVVLLFTGRKRIKFNIKHYLDGLNEQDKNIVIPYIQGAFTLGMIIPLSLWIIDVGVDTLVDKLQHKNLERIYSYKVIGYCYVDENCRDIVVTNPVQTDEDVTKVTEQIRRYMISNKSK